jgi:hypothetical protein
VPPSTHTRRRGLARIVTLGLVAATLGACGSDRTRTDTASATAPPKADRGLQARNGNGPDVRICGFLSEGKYTASQVEMTQLTCPQTALVVKSFLAAGLEGPAGWSARVSQGPRRGAPPGTHANRYVRLRRAGSPGKVLIAFLLGEGKHGRSPNPVVRLQAGDDRDITPK